MGDVRWKRRQGNGLYQLLNSTMYSDYLIAQQHLIKTYIKEDLTGYTEDEDGLKAMKDEKNMRKKRGNNLWTV